MVCAALRFQLLACVAAAWTPRHMSPASSERSRRVLLSETSAVFAAMTAGSVKATAADSWMDQNKARMTYPDFKMTPSGMQFKDAVVGEGPLPEPGDRVVLDWSGYTIGYNGRPFEMRARVASSDFKDEEKELWRPTLGTNSIVPGVEEAILGMRVGGIRQVVVPFDLSYPTDDRDHQRVGPRPTSFSGQRALDFVLTSVDLIDKTLLFNIKLKRIDKAGEQAVGGGMR